MAPRLSQNYTLAPFMKLDFELKYFQKLHFGPQNSTTLQNDPKAFTKLGVVIYVHVSGSCRVN